MKFKKLSIPLKAPKKWVAGDLAILYITLVPEESLDPPCLIVMVTEATSTYETIVIGTHNEHKAARLMSVTDVLQEWEGHDDMSLRAHRKGAEKLKNLRGFTLSKEDENTMLYWEDNPCDRPDCWDLLKSVLTLA